MVAKTTFSALALGAAVAVAADCSPSSDASSVNDKLDQLKSDTDKVDSSIKGLSDSASLEDALPIQDESATVLKDTQDATKAIQGLSNVNDCDGNAIGSKIAGSAGSISQSLKDITDKADTFKKIGADSLVTKNLNDLQKASVDFITAVYKVLPCSAVEQTFDGLDGVASAFKSAADAYGLDSASYPDHPKTCSSSDGGSSGGSSAAATSGAATSAAATSAAGSEAATSAAGSGVAQETSAAAGGNSTSVDQTNGAGKVAVGGLAGVAAAALLL